MKFSIRKATTSDTPTLLQFEQGIIAAERPFDETLGVGEIHYYDLNEMITATHIELLVAETDEKLIGSGYVRVEASKPFLKHKQHAYLGFMYVEPEYRGKGVNKAIIESLGEWAKAQGVFEMRLEVYYGNYPAIKAYEKVGFESLLIEMRKGLN